MLSGYWGGKSWSFTAICKMERSTQASLSGESISGYSTSKGRMGKNKAPSWILKYLPFEYILNSANAAASCII